MAATDPLRPIDNWHKSPNVLLVLTSRVLSEDEVFDWDDHESEDEIEAVPFNVETGLSNDLYYSHRCPNVGWNM